MHNDLRRRSLTAGAVRVAQTALHVDHDRGPPGGKVIRERQVDIDLVCSSEFFDNGVLIVTEHGIKAGVPGSY